MTQTISITLLSIIDDHMYLLNCNLHKLRIKYITPYLQFLCFFLKPYGSSRQKTLLLFIWIIANAYHKRLNINKNNSKTVEGGLIPPQLRIISTNNLTITSTINAKTISDANRLVLEFFLRRFFTKRSWKLSVLIDTSAT